jgi:prolyl-tRNA editing enzyme YbaK/EbsC (Cys-tRNA(Pro) deacylase)
MAASLKPSAQRVQDALTARGFPNQVVELAESTRTAAEAAAAVGCSVAQIAKSLLFRALAADGTSRPVLVIAGGANRVNVRLLEAEVGCTLERPDADYVREQTGYVIGGVPPVGHVQPLDCWMDVDLWQHDAIWAAAGHPNAVFPLTPDELRQMTGGRVVRIT